MLEFKGRTAVVTGSARGIGKAIALKLAEMGANIVLNGTPSSGHVDEVQKEVEAMGVQSVVVKCDVKNMADAQKLIDTAIEKFGAIDILVNNAGITKDNLVLKMTEADWDDVIDINLKGAFNCIKCASKIMLKQRNGKIINVASVSGVVGAAGQANYSSSKAGLIGLTKACAKEFASRGINVNAIAPGLIETNMTQKLPDAVKEEYMRNIPLKRFGTPDDVANVVSFLASEKSNYVTGQVICIDGGMVM